MNIIGHRGSRGLAPENTILSIQKAIDTGAKFIEIDIRTTKDGELVLCHDKHTKRITGKWKIISQTNLVDLKNLATKSGEPMTTLKEVLKKFPNTCFVIEGKNKGWAEPLHEILKKHRTNKETFILSFNHKELLRFKKFRPDMELVVSEHFSPFIAIYFAKENNLRGICFRSWHYQPLVYWLANKYGLDMFAYTVNNRQIANFFQLLYPKVHLITDFTDRFSSSTNHKH